MPGFWQAVADWLGWEPVPGTPEHREALFRAVKAKNDELAKPPEQRDEARLVELIKRVLRLRIETIQANKQLMRRNARVLLQRPDLGCCPDCPRVLRRQAASLQAMAAWQDEWELVYTLRLQALEQGHPYPPLTLPYLDLQPFLPEGLPEDFPPSIDRCAACQHRLEEYLFRERELHAAVDTEP